MRKGAGPGITRADPGRGQLVGPAALLSGWLVALLVGVSEAPSWGWGSPKVIALIGVAVAVAVAWVFVESRSKNPLVDMKMIALALRVDQQSRSFPLRHGHVLGHGIPARVLADAKINGLRVRGQHHPVRPVPSTAHTRDVPVRPLVREDCCPDRFPIGCHHRIRRIFWRLLHLGVRPFPRVEIYLASTLLGVGLGLAFSAMSNLIVQAVPPAQTGVASGMNANIRTIGGAIGAAAMSSIVTSHLLVSRFPSVSGYTTGFAFLGAITIVAVIAATLVPKATAAKADTDQGPHLQNAELALLAGTIAEE